MPSPSRRIGAPIPLLVALKEWRRVTAISRGLAETDVLSDTAVSACIAQLPRTAEDLQSIPLTELQRQQFGAALLTCLAPYTAQPGLSRPTPETPRNSQHARQGLCKLLWMDPAPHVWPLMPRTVQWHDHTITVLDASATTILTFTADHLKITDQRLEATRIHPSQRLVVTWTEH
ncbi:MAG: HRDC domain-containing protein [Firmicutes bacterium]|nr:HRDC domain-containing protein [Bacillota bacterium]